ncbi:MAG: hypothetical protein MUP55_02700 [Candidatus Aenigmarchaeota archaeon]|nr:hypothetical protein [Candidatus Aenigmarchaeota archaeon]
MDEDTIRALDVMRVRNGDLTRSEQIRRLIIQNIDNYTIIVKLTADENSMIEAIGKSNGVGIRDKGKIISLCLQGFWTITSTPLYKMLKPLKRIEQDLRKGK